MLRRLILTLASFLLTASLLSAADPTETHYTWDECRGSFTPYPAPSHSPAYPDSLTPVMINHVGRHGARFPSSAKNCNLLVSALGKAEAAGTITPLGRNMLRIVRDVMTRVNGRWGALDSLGMAEQRGIASRMMAAYPELFRGTLVSAISSYSPRCIMSMDEFTHQLARMDNSVELTFGSGRRYSSLVRFFDLSEPYKEFRQSPELEKTLADFTERNCPVSQVRRIMGQKFDFEAQKVDIRKVALAQFSVLSGLNAMGMTADVAAFLNPSEQNALWSIANLHHYLERSASTLSTVPAAIASPLLEDLIATTDAFIAGDLSVGKVNLRFGHAETLMPLLALMHLPGCYYLTNYFDTVGLHWRDFDVVPMAANLQMILFRTRGGDYYVRVDLNEVPVPLIPNSTSLYTPWPEARNYLQRCLPLI